MMIRNLAAVGGMTLALLAILAAMMRAMLAHCGTMGQTLALAALFALVYGGTLAAFVWLLVRPDPNAPRRLARTAAARANG